jgi:hypothetical protein
VVHHGGGRGRGQKGRGRRGTARPMGRGGSSSVDTELEWTDCRQPVSSGAIRFEGALIRRSGKVGRWIGSTPTVAREKPPPPPNMALACDLSYFFASFPNKQAGIRDEIGKEVRREGA